MISDICLYCGESSVKDKFGYNQVIDNHRCHGGCITRKQLEELNSEGEE